MKKSIGKLIGITWELCGGRTLSQGATDMITEKLKKYPEKDVENALLRCQDECIGKISIGDIIARIKTSDGRPGADEAWALLPQSEEDSVVWTEEMSQAWGTAKNVMDDQTAARLAFRDTYNRLVSEARQKRLPVNWIWSPGINQLQRERALLEAVGHKRITIERALELSGAKKYAAFGVYCIESDDKEKDVKQIPTSKISKLVSALENKMTAEKEKN